MVTYERFGVLETTLGALRLNDARILLCAGRHGPAGLHDAVFRDRALHSRIQGWAVPPCSLNNWVAQFGEDSPALELALHVDDEVDYVACADPLPDAPEGVAVETLFDPSETDDLGRLQVVDFDPDTPVRSLLDASAIFGLPERLVGSGAAHDCVFTGEARDELADAAPWVAELDPGTSLFTDAMDAQAGLGFTGDADLAALRKRARKFTKLPNSGGTWVYFRPCSAAFIDWVRLHPAGPFPSGFVAPGLGVLLPLGDGGSLSLRLEIGSNPARSAEFLPRFSRFSRMRLRRAFVLRAKDAIEDVLDQDIPFRRAVRHYATARDFGYRRERAIVRIMEASLRLAQTGRSLKELETSAQMAQYRTASDVHRAAAALELARNHTGASR